MRPFNLDSAFFDAEPLNGILIEYRPSIFHEKGQYFIAEPGLSIGEMADWLVANEHTAPAFTKIGAGCIGKDIIRPDDWGRVRPKPDTIVFLSVVPQKGDNMFLQIAGIALAAVAVAVSGGALATLAPALFGAFTAGSFAAAAAGAAIAPEGSIIAHALVKP